jgi:hypothetical protein
MRRFLANILFVFIGLPVALSALFLLSARPWALDRDTYKRFVEDDRLYAALQAPEMASRAPATIELRAAGSSISADGPSLVSAAQKDLPWPVIKSTASRAVDAALDAAEGRTPGSMEIDLKPLKAALKSKSPAVARDYLAALAASGRPDPAGALGAGAKKPAALSAVFNSAIDTIPDAAKADASTFPAPRGRLRGPLDKLPIGVMSRGDEPLTQALLNRMTATSVAMSALLLAGLGALGGTGLVSRLSRAGKYLLIPSILVLAVGAILAVPGGLILQNVLPAEARAMIAGSGGAMLRDYLASALGPIARSFLITGLVGASLGGVLSSARKFGEPRELEDMDSSAKRFAEPKELE